MGMYNQKYVQWEIIFMNSVGIVWSFYSII